MLSVFNLVVRIIGFVFTPVFKHTCILLKLYATSMVLYC